MILRCKFCGLLITSWGWAKFRTIFCCFAGLFFFVGSWEIFLTIPFDWILTCCCKIRARIKFKSSSDELDTFRSASLKLNWKNETTYKTEERDESLPFLPREGLVCFRLETLIFWPPSTFHAQPRIEPTITKDNEPKLYHYLREKIKIVIFLNRFW